MPPPPQPEFLPDGTAKLFRVPFTPLLSFLVDGKNLEGREEAGKCSPGAPAVGNPGVGAPGSRDPDSHAAAAPPPPRPSSSPWCPCGPDAGCTVGGRLWGGGREEGTNRRQSYVMLRIHYAICAWSVAQSHIVIYITHYIYRKSRSVMPNS